MVLANGCFDLLHYGHLLHLVAAKNMGDYLVVSITNDANINKGPGRPVYPQDHRAALVGHLKCVDEVLIVESLIQAMELVKPDILVKGQDYKRGLDQEHEEYCRLHDIEIRYTDTPKYSATQLIRVAQLRQGL